MCAVADESENWEIQQKKHMKLVVLWRFVIGSGIANSEHYQRYLWLINEPNEFTV